MEGALSQELPITSWIVMGLDAKEEGFWHTPYVDLGARLLGYDGAYGGMTNVDGFGDMFS